MSNADLHDVWKTGLPLGISCNHCLHRALVPPERIGAQEGNLRCIDSLRFQCSKCRHRSHTAHLFRLRAETRRFMAEYR